MGKKNKKAIIKLSEKELEPATIGIMEEDKKGPLGLIILFVIFILFSIFLPNITNYVNKLLEKDENKIVTPQVESEEKQNPIEEEEIVMYDFSEDLKFTTNKLTFSNFKKYQTQEGYYVSFVIANGNDENINFKENRYFIETYSNEKTLLDRHIFGDITINVKANASQIIELTEEEYNALSKVVISLKNEKDYPDVVLKSLENNEYLLTCKKEESTIIYTFDKNNQLIKIKDTFNYTNDNSSTYKAYLSLYQERVADYNNQAGVSSSLIEISSGFTANTEITIKSANLKELNNEHYYTNDAMPKVVKFEMEARGYSCQ